MIFDRMIGSVKTIIEKIHFHHFNQELAKGTLPEDKFIFYLIQDALYLADFSRALALTAAKLPNNQHMQQFIEFSLGAVKAERDLHFGYINKYQSKNSKGTSLIIEQSPSCFMYTNYILKMASMASVEEAVSSLLPCFFIYNEVGKKMVSNHLANNPYYDWIELYSGESFERSVRSAINTTNELALSASELTHEKMIAAFARSTQLEWLFWESAYCQETWLVEEDAHVV